MRLGKSTPVKSNLGPKKKISRYVSVRDFPLNSANIAAEKHQFHLIISILTWHLPQPCEIQSPKCRVSVLFAPCVGNMAATSDLIKKEMNDLMALPAGQRVGEEDCNNR